MEDWIEYAQKLLTTDLFLVVKYSMLIVISGPRSQIFFFLILYMKSMDVKILFVKGYRWGAQAISLD